MMKKIIVFLSVVLIITMMTATVVESFMGTSFVGEHIYGAWWFVALWAVLTLAGSAYVVKRKLYRNSAAMLLHASFVVILAGAFVTHLSQTKGMIHLRQDIPTSSFIQNDGLVKGLNFNLRLDSFYISYKEDSKKIADYTSVVTVLPAGEQHTISMNNILKVGKVRFYQADYDPDLHGSVLMVNRDPWGIPITYTGYCLLALGFLLIFLRKENRLSFLISMVLAAFIAYLFSRKEYDIPVLNTWLLPVHVSLIITAYVLLFFAIWFRKLLVVAVGLLSIGIFIGAYWANISWGTYWNWDSKEVWALITLLISAAPLHKASLPLLNTKKAYRLYMVITLLAVLMTYFGVNYLLPGMHSYA